MNTLAFVTLWLGMSSGAPLLQAQELDAVPLKPYLIVTSPKDERVEKFGAFLPEDKIRELSEAEGYVLVEEDHYFYLYSKNLWFREGVEKFRNLVDRLSRVPESMVASLDSFPARDREDLISHLLKSPMGKGLEGPIEQNELRLRLSYAVNFKVGQEGEEQFVSLHESNFRRTPDLYAKEVYRTGETDIASTGRGSVEEAAPLVDDPSLVFYIPRPNLMRPQEIATQTARAARLLELRQQEYEEAYQKERMKLFVELAGGEEVWGALLSGEPVQAKNLPPLIATKLAQEMKINSLDPESTVQIERASPILLMQRRSTDGVRRFTFLGLNVLYP